MNLVIHGADVSTPDLKALHRIVAGKDIERVGENAFRITHAHPADRAGVGRPHEAAGLHPLRRAGWRLG